MEEICYTGCHVASMSPEGRAFGLIPDAALAVSGGKVVWVGRKCNLPAHLRTLPEDHLGGRLVTPSLIDCHTHLIFGGNRAAEFEMRLCGATYEEIAREGGGIASTVRATRETSNEDLLASALKRVDALMSEGVAVFEIKSGYGLTVDDELRMLRIARRIAQLRPVKVKTSWLAAHAAPVEYKGRLDAYIDEVVIPGLVEAHEEGLVDAVDGFCESVGFSPEQIERVFQAAKLLGLPVRLHAEQLSNRGGALLAASHGALSADHLEYLAEEDVEAFARAGTVAVLLPGAFYMMREKKAPPVEALRRHGAPIAIATDCNPGTSPISSILTVMNMACTLFALTPEEALAGTTRNAAKALGLAAEYGVIAPGARAEFAVWDADHPAELSYWIGRSPLWKSISHR